MSKPAFQDLFAFNGRRNRLSYFLYNITWTVVALIFVVLIVKITPKGQHSESLIIGIATILFIPAGISNLAVTTQRCRDLDWSGWTCLIILIPVIGGIFSLLLTFMPGTVGPNAYGPDPKRPDLGRLDAGIS